MSATLERPAATPAAVPPSPAPEPWARSEALVLAATLLLLVTASLPLARVYVGLGFFRIIFAALLLSLGLSWGSRRLGAGPLASLAITVAGWVVFVSAAFFSDTLFGGVLPGSGTAGAAISLWARGIQLMLVRPPPAFAEAGLMFITVTGLWAVVHAVEGLVFRLAGPVKAILMALVLWLVPLLLAPPSTKSWLWATPFLAASAALMLTFAGTDLRRWGIWAPAVRPGTPARTPPLLPAGAVLATVAIIAGATMAGSLPGFKSVPWYELRGAGGTTLTTNPIVDIRTRLVAQDTGPVLKVVTERPVYLRTTGLDVYSESEEWTSSGIRGTGIGDTLPFEVPLGPVERVQLDVEVRNLPGAVLVPAPYQTLSVDGPLVDDFRYDTQNSTVTLDAGVELQRNDTYSLIAAIPAPTADQLDAAQISVSPRLTQLPDNIPPRVVELARDIVERERARTPFAQALAIQNELRSWKYSTQPPQGHGGQAMVTFITNRIGYCEQYAGTMAVMLRSLGMPARVAVGYTPGELAPRTDDTYLVSNGNAHAWVEVLFEGLGWVAFEPTPRSDGNVLVPNASNVAPSRTVAATGGQPEDEPTESPTIDTLGPNQDVRPQDQRPDPTEEATPNASGASGAGGSGGDQERSPVLPFLLLGLLGTALAVAAVASTRGHHDLPGRPPLERVMHARAEVEQLARGMGIAPAAWETDREYLQRVAHRHGQTARAAGDVLAAQVGRARYAQQLPETSAVEAEHAALGLQTAMLADHSAFQRATIRLRGRTSAGLARARRRLRQPASSSRRRAASR